MKIIISALMLCCIFMSFSMICNDPQYHPSKGEQLVNNILGKTAKIIKDKHNLKPSGSGASMPEGPIRELALCFDTKSPLAKEQLRDLLIKTSNELVKQVNDNKEFQEFLKEPPFTIDIQIIIYNHDKMGKTLYDPDILTAQISQGILTYRTVESDSHLKLKQEFTETYEDALKIVQNAISEGD